MLERTDGIDLEEAADEVHGSESDELAIGRHLIPVPCRVSLRR
jgi:hypothetical protein